MDKPKRQKQLSQEAKDLVKDETKKNIDENMEYIRENFSKIIADHIFTVQEIKRKAILEDKEEMTNYILEKYLPIQRKINVIKKTLLSEEEQKECEEKIIKGLMESNFQEKTTYYEEVQKNYAELQKIFNFIDTSMNDYKKTLEEKINHLENINKSKNSPQFKCEIEKQKNKIYILENHFKKGEPAKVIKLAIYENERRYAYDLKEVLQEMSEYFTTFFTIIDMFS